VKYRGNIKQDRVEIGCDDGKWVLEDQDLAVLEAQMLVILVIVLLSCASVLPC
jgi:hypothetical protein